MFRFLEIIGTSLKMALEKLRSNKLRTFLSLFSITIGIFCIIGVLATVNSLKRNVQNDINALGTNSVFIDKWQYGRGPNAEWRKQMKRPEFKFEEMKLLKRRINSASHMAMKSDARDKIE